MFGSGRETLPVDREWLGSSHEYPGVVGRPSRWTGSGREAVTNIREWSEGPPGCPGVVWRPAWKSGSGLEALPEDQV